MINKRIDGRKMAFTFCYCRRVLLLQLPLIDRDRMDALKDICWASVSGKDLWINTFVCISNLSIVTNVCFLNSALKQFLPDTPAVS